MAEKETLLRGTLFGGFRRQDVMHYLEQLVQEHETQTAALEKELDQLRQTLTAAEDHAMQLEEEQTTLSAQLKTAQDDMKKSAGQVDEKQTEIQTLRDRIRALEPDAAAYDSLRARTAQIETEANQMAQRILDQANTRATAQQTRVARWTEEIGVRYDALATDIDATLAHLSGELTRVQGVIAQMQEVAPRQAEALAALKRAGSSELEKEKEEHLQV